MMTTCMDVPSEAGTKYSISMRGTLPSAAADPKLGVERLRGIRGGILTTAALTLEAVDQN